MRQWVIFNDNEFEVMEIKALCRMKIVAVVQNKNVTSDIWENSSFRNMHLYSVDLRSDWLIRKNRPIPKSIIRKCSANNRINSIRTYLNGTEQIRTDTNWYEEICIFRPVRSNMWVSLNKHIGHMVPHVYNVFSQKCQNFKKVKNSLFRKMSYLLEMVLCVNQLTISQSRTL